MPFFISELNFLPMTGLLKHKVCFRGSKGDFVNMQNGTCVGRSCFDSCGNPMENTKANMWKTQCGSQIRQYWGRLGGSTHLWLALAI